MLSRRERGSAEDVADFVADAGAVDDVDGFEEFVADGGGVGVPDGLVFEVEDVFEDGFFVTELTESVGALAPADAGVFDTSEGSLDGAVVAEELIDADVASDDTARDGSAALGVACPDGAVESVLGVVGVAKSFIGVTNFHDGEDRPKGLLGHDEHVVVNVREDSGFIKGAVLKVGVAAAAGAE